MSMELRHLHTFIALAEELHFGRAAARLHVVQPAVSQTLKHLEAEVGARLLERSSRRVSLTPAGQGFLEHARRALAEVDHAVASARRLAAGEQGSLTLRFTAMSALTVLPRALARYRDRYPAVDVQLQQGGTEDTLEALRHGRCDLGFTALPDPVPGLSSEPISDDRLVAVLPLGHRLERRRSVRFAELAADPVVALPRHAEPGIHERHRAACAVVGATPRVALEVDTVEGLVAFVATGLGVAFLPETVRRLRPMGVCIVPVTPSEPARVFVVWPAAATVTSMRFLEVLRSERDQSDGPHLVRGKTRPRSP